MRGAGRTVYIAGAGIAGLTLALALAKFGASVVVLERTERVQETGAGLQVSPNARRVLNQLGLDQQMREASFEPQGIDIYPFGARRPLTTLVLGQAVTERFGAPYAVMHRADLAELLYRACRRFANIDMLFGVRSFTVRDDAGGVAVTVEQADSTARSGRAFAFVGADGVNSHTRTEILNGPQATYSGRVAWRATVPLEALGDALAPDRVSLLLAPGRHAVCYPLVHHGQMNVALFDAGHDEAKGPRLSRAMLGSRQFGAIAAAAGESWTYWPLASVRAPRWHRNAIGLVGDAAHAMMPFQAQGAAMAIEDAAILAPLLMSAANGGAAFSRYESLRLARVERVRRVSERNGSAFHLHWPFTLARNLVIGLGGPRDHLRRLAWLYGYDPAVQAGAAAGAQQR